MTEWQPIETAPMKDGFAAIVYVPGLNDWRRPHKLPRIVVAVLTKCIGGQNGWAWISDYAEMDGGYESTGDYISHPPVYPTHFIPLPSPPEQ